MWLIACITTLTFFCLADGLFPVKSSSGICVLIFFSFVFLFFFFFQMAAHPGRDPGLPSLQSAVVHGRHVLGQLGRRAARVALL